MPFDKVETQIDFPAQERAILEHWNRIQAFDKLREQNRGKPKWSFLDGPITANNPMGVHHAWGRTYKDAYQRYQAMTAHELRYQNGFDCQGLWVEVEVEKELQLRSKRDIEELVSGDRFASIDRFVQLCKERVDKFARIQTDQSIRLGYWMDWDRTDADWARPPDQRREEQFKRKEWVEGVPKLKTLEQLFKEKGGYEVLGEVHGSALVGWTYDGPFDELDAQNHPAGYPAEIADVVLAQSWAAPK